MSDAGSADSGGGSAVTPGWYTDPHDPRQLRWWSGEGWTEHVSPGSGQQPAQQQETAQPAGQQPTFQQPEAQQPAVVQPEAAQPLVQPEVQQPAVPQQVQQPAAQDPSAPLPSRRALRDPASEASEAAEAALAAQAQQQAAQQQAFPPVQASQPDFAQPVPAQPAAAQPVAAAPDLVQPEFVQPQAPVSAQPASAPVPTLPVAPTSFLEQQGYAPLDGAPAEQNGWSQPAAQQSPQPAQAPQPAQVPQPAQGPQPAQAPQPVEPQEPAIPGLTLPPVDVEPNNWNQPQASAWNQPVAPEQTLPPVQAAQPNAWNQPLEPTAPAQPSQLGWGAPAAAPDGIDGLFTGAPADAVTDAQPGQWGLAPSDPGTDTRTTAAVDKVAGSSSFWAWVIAISPILAAGAIMYVLLATKSTLTDWPFEAAVAAPYLLVLLFALGDRASLLSLGHTSPRSPAWALLTAPVYLIARAGETRREDGSGTALTLVWFVSFLVAIGGIVGYGILTHHALFAGLPT